MERFVGPLLTSLEFDRLIGARDRGVASVECSLDLRRTTSTVDIGAADWRWLERRFSYPRRYRERTIYYWEDDEFLPLARYGSSLVKLVPTPWGAPTFEIDGIKMLPTAERSPYADAERKVSLIEPRGKVVLDTCGGLGYFAAWCLRGGVRSIVSFEKNSDVLWLRKLNPWSPAAAATLALHSSDVTQAILTLPAASFDAALHDPPRFGIAGELYSQHFYGELARVLKRRGSLFHYTGSPNRLTTGRDVPNEVSKRLHRAGFTTTKVGDGILAVNR
jgi:predicted methyltransferase